MTTNKDLQTIAYQHLKELLSNGSFEQDVIYSERKVAKDLGISRTPLRDAIHMLVQEKYIDIIPNKGFRLHVMNSTDIIETFQIRSALEGYCTLQISKNHTGIKEQELLSQLAHSLEQQKHIMETSHSINDFLLLDNEFHLMIVKFLENKSFNEMFTSLLYRIQELARLSLSYPGRMEETYEEHYAMYEAMHTGNVNQVHSITMVHMDRPKAINLNALNQK